MEFRLTYEGQLLGASRTNSRASHKHDIRKVFHQQLKRLWATNSFLANSRAYGEISNGRMVMLGISRKEKLASQFARFGYQFIPLVTEQLALICSIDILFLRPQMPGTIVNSGDLDNRLKTLLDALRIPNSEQELGGSEAPHNDEVPFFCLLEDDALITHISITTDTLLQPVGADFSNNDARLVVRVNIKPHVMDVGNIEFG